MCQNRAAYIDELYSFINSSKYSLDSVLKTVNWTKQSLLSAKEVEPFQNPEEDTVQNASHTEDGTVVEGQVYILDMHYGNPLGTISFSLLTSLNNESGGGDHLYNDIVASLLATEQPFKTEKKDFKVEDKAEALKQLLKVERDAKRRRISYRNKVHTKNKSHTEILKEVLQEQMLTITGLSGNDSSVATNDGLQQSTNQAQELIAVRPPQGNPHLAWLDILKKEEGDRKWSDYRSDESRSHKSEHSIHNRRYVDHKESCKNEEEKGSKIHRKDMKRKLEDNGKHHKTEKNDWDGIDRNSSANYKDRHHKKKKKKRSRSRSPRPEISTHHRHKSKHKKKKH